MFESSHYDLFVKQLENGEQAVSLRYQLGELTHTEKEIILPQGKIQLRVKGSNEIYLFEYATDGKTFKELGRMNTRYISTETAGGFTGIMLGLYTTSSSDTSKHMLISNILITKRTSLLLLFVASNKPSKRK